MAKRDDTVYLSHILESAERIGVYISKTKKKLFLNDNLLQDGVIRQIEIIGEATKNLSSGLRNKYPEVPWKDMAGMRDKLIHDYLGVDLNAVWLAAKKDIPLLRKNIEKILKGA